MNRAERKKQKNSRPEGQRKKQASYWNAMRKVKNALKSAGNNTRGTTQGSARLWATGKSKLIQIAAHAHPAAPGQWDSRMPHTSSSPESWFQSLATAATRQWALQSTQQQKCSAPPHHPSLTNNCCTRGGVERSQVNKKYIIIAKPQSSSGFHCLWGSDQAEDAWHLYKLFLQLLTGCHVLNEEHGENEINLPANMRGGCSQNMGLYSPCTSQPHWLISSHFLALQSVASS